MFVSAAGTFLTESDADADGYYRITAITGTANSATITALQPTGTSVPGNEGFPVDNLVRTTAPLLSKHGFWIHGFPTGPTTIHFTWTSIATTYRVRPMQTAREQSRVSNLRLLRLPILTVQLDNSMACDLRGNDLVHPRGEHFKKLCPYLCIHPPRAHRHME